VVTKPVITKPPKVPSVVHTPQRGSQHADLNPVANSAKPIGTAGQTQSCLQEGRDRSRSSFAGRRRPEPGSFIKMAKSSGDPQVHKIWEDRRRPLCRSRDKRRADRRSYTIPTHVSVAVPIAAAYATAPLNGRSAVRRRWRRNAGVTFCPRPNLPRAKAVAMSLPRRAGSGRRARDLCRSKFHRRQRQSDVVSRRLPQRMRTKSSIQVNRTGLF